MKGQKKLQTLVINQDHLDWKLSEIEIYQSNEDQTIVGMSIIFIIEGDKKEYKINESQFELNSKKFLIENLQQSYIQKARLQYSKKGLRYFELNFKKQDDNSKDRDIVIGTLSHEPQDQEIEEIIESDVGSQLKIEEIKYLKTIQNIKISQQLLFQFQPSTLVRRTNDNNEKFILNYNELMFLEGLIPLENDCNEQYIKLYDKLHEAIQQVKNQKLLVSDLYEETLSFYRMLDDTFREISRNIAPSLKGKNKFHPKDYPKELEKLLKLKQYSKTIQEQFEKLDKQSIQLRSQSLQVNEIKRKLLSEEKVLNCLSYNENDTSFQKQAERSLKASNDKKFMLIQQIEEIEKSTDNLKQNIEILENLIKQKNKQIQDLENVKIQQSSKEVQKQQQLVDSSQQQFNELAQLEKELEDQQQLIQKSYLAKLKKLEERIEIERDKMHSSQQIGQAQGQKGKNRHFICVFDESGSQSSNWPSITATFNKFMQDFKDAGDNQNLFTVILFDDSVRLICQRQKANQVQSLPNLRGGGTTYSGGLELAKQMVEITGSDMQPVIIFFTDGQAGDPDKSKVVLKNISELRQSPQVFFIGFGSGFNMSFLQELSKIGNKGNTSIKVGNQSVNFVQAALNSTQLNDIFVNLSSQFSCECQELSIEAFERQKEKDKQEFKNQIDHLQSIYKARIDNQKQLKEQRLKLMSDVSKGNLEKLNELTNQELKTVNEDLDRLNANLKQQNCELTTQESKQSNFKEELKLVEQQVQEFQQIYDQDSKNDKELLENRKNKLQNLVKDSGFKHLDEMKQFYGYIGSIDGTIQNMISSIKQIKNLQKILEEKIDELIFQLSEGYGQLFLKNKTDENIFDALVQYQKLEKDPKIRDITQKNLLLHILSMRLSQKEYLQYERFYSILLDRLELRTLALCKKNQIPKIAARLASKLMIKEAEDSDDSDKDDSDGDSDGKYGKDFNIDIEKEQFDEEIIFPQDQKQAKEKIKAITKKLKKMGKDKDQDARVKRRKYKNKIIFFQTLMKEDKLADVFEICLIQLFEIIYKSIGQEIMEQIFIKFDTTFSFFQKNVQGQLMPFKETVYLYTLENKIDVQAAVKQINCKKQDEMEMIIAQQKRMNGIKDQMEQNPKIIQAIEF